MEKKGQGSAQRAGPRGEDNVLKEPWRRAELL